MSKTKPAGGRENLGRALTLHPAGGLLVGQAHSVGPKGVTRPGLAIETLTVELWARRPRAVGGNAEIWRAGAAHSGGRPPDPVPRRQYGPGWPGRQNGGGSESTPLPIHRLPTHPHPQEVT